MGKNKDKSSAVLFFWNEDAFSESLKNNFDEKCIITSQEDFKEKIKRGHLANFKRIVILAELKWDSHAYSDLYGYEIAEQLISKDITRPLLFCSFLERDQIKTMSRSASILCPIFNHIRLPFPNGFLAGIDKEIDPVSDMRWFYIQNYEIKVGVIDKICHDLAHYSSITSAPDKLKILETIKSRYDVCISRESKSFLQKSISSLYNADLNASNEQTIQFLAILEKEKKVDDTAPIKRTAPKYSIILVEDKEEIRVKLVNDLMQYFTVFSFGSSAEAFTELSKNSDKISALVTDFELLDNQGNWQNMQGFELLVAANKYPHLALIGLTGIPKTASATINFKLRQSCPRAAIFYKDTTISSGETKSTPFPLNWSAKQFSEVIEQEIERRNAFRQGPKLGAWKIGLLALFYDMKSADENAWREFWTSVENCANNIVENNKNSNDSIKKLFTENKKGNFTAEDLFTALVHRLVNLYYYYSNNKLDFSEIKNLIGFVKTDFAQYYNATLGFSAREKETGSNTIELFKIELLPEEAHWLKKQTNLSNIGIKVPQVVRYLQQANEVLPPARQYTKSIASLEDLFKMVSYLKKQKIPKVISTINMLDDYFLPNEDNWLGSSVMGRKLLKAINEFCD